MEMFTAPDSFLLFVTTISHGVQQTSVIDL